MTDADIEAFFATLAAANPQPASELEYSSVFELLAAVLLSAQATDVSVNNATRRLFAVADTPQRMLALGLPALTDHIRTIGLYRNKASNLVQTCRLLIERHGGAVPRSREALEALPGVGSKTASVVLNVAFGDEAIAVDTHVFRVANRTGLAPGRTPLAVEHGLLQRVPSAYCAAEANYSSPLLKNMIFFSAAKHVSTKNFLVSPLYNQRPWPGALVTSSLNI